MQTGPNYQPPPPPPPPYYYPPYQPQQQRPMPPQRGTAIAVEAVLALFGVYGVGWLMDGKSNVGIPVMIGGFVWDIFAIFTLVFTAGFGFCCLVPLHFTFIAMSSILLARQP